METSRLRDLHLEHCNLIRKLYGSFASGDADGMAACYHPDIVFEDPAFGILRGKEVAAMWRMLLERSKGQLEIGYSDVQADEHRGSAQWVATYVFQATGRRVVNRVSATFEFNDGLIVRHTDHFDFWLWTKQALGWKGWLLGWTSWMQSKVQKQTNTMLRRYMAKTDSRVAGSTKS